MTATQRTRIGIICRHNLDQLAWLTEHAPNRPAALARHLGGMTPRELATHHVYASEHAVETTDLDVLTALRCAYLDRGEPRQESLL